MARGLLGIASAIALLTLLSKAFGFGRELVVAYVFGAGIAKDAYTAAYIIPAFSLIMLGGLTGPFHTTTQKVIATLRQRGEDADVPAVMAAIMGVVAVVMGGLALLAYFGAPWLILAVASQMSPETAALAVAQLRLMSPLLLVGGLVGILCGISNDRGDYTLPSLSPLVASLAIIAVILLRPDPMSLALGTMLGGVGQLLLQAPAGVKLFAQGLPARLPFRHPEVSGMWRLLLPACVSSSIGTLNVIIGTNFASALPSGSMSVFDYANKLLQLPLGILMTALLVPLFPLLTKAAVNADREGLAHWMNRGIGTISLATLPLVALFVALGEPLVAVVYERGAFDQAATTQTYWVLAVSAAGVWAYGVRDLFIRVFYSLDDGRTPMGVALLSMLATALAMAAVIKPFGLLGLAGATAAVTVLNCALNAWLLHRKLGGLPVGPSVPTFFKAFAAAAAGAVAGRLIAGALPVGEGFFADLARLAAGGGGLVAVYGGALMLLGVPVTSALARFRRKGAPAAS